MSVSELRPPRRTRRLARPLAVGVASVAALVALVVAARFAFGTYDEWATVHRNVRHLKPYLVALQGLAIAALWVAWPWLVGRLARWPDDARAALLAARHRICAGLVVIELVVVLGFPFSLF
ncbi:hypothetical protein [Aromatoleum bremense]|uniref:Uncharacterized protein n=1 Tax=Aromatoleum bremense TaxID=76115 RepID=A0ABX1NWV2_9RHOO|nr:hypothetical protein [Aromatoleum bremense]NMG16256.1 hypothetical protein [Aromatoleum bremense]QTQ30098.1 Uncharacterized protein pbN1_01050 [Aromatoleum bremense]